MPVVPSGGMPLATAAYERLVEYTSDRLPCDTEESSTFLYIRLSTLPMAPIDLPRIVRSLAESPLANAAVRNSTASHAVEPQRASMEVRRQPPSLRPPTVTRRRVTSRPRPRKFTALAVVKEPAGRDSARPSAFAGQYQPGSCCLQVDAQVGAQRGRDLC
jgi:hypothetical protein